jgi:hypothetical protein
MKPINYNPRQSLGEFDLERLKKQTHVSRGRVGLWARRKSRTPFLCSSFAPLESIKSQKANVDVKRMRSFAAG